MRSATVNGLRLRVYRKRDGGLILANDAQLFHPYAQTVAWPARRLGRAGLGSALVTGEAIFTGRHWGLGLWAVSEGRQHGSSRRSTTACCETPTSL